MSGCMRDSELLIDVRRTVGAAALCVLAVAPVSGQSATVTVHHYVVAEKDTSLQFPRLNKLTTKLREKLEGSATVHVKVRSGNECPVQAGSRCDIVWLRDDNRRKSATLDVDPSPADHPSFSKGIPCRDGLAGESSCWTDVLIWTVREVSRHHAAYHIGADKKLPINAARK